MMDDTVIVVLKNQTQIVCNLKEVYEGSEENKKGICLLMIHPYVLKIVGNGEDENIQIRFENGVRIVQTLNLKFLMIQ